MFVACILLIPTIINAKDKYDNVCNYSKKSISSSSYPFDLYIDGSYFSLSVGTGISYAGNGIMASLITGERFRFFGSIGKYPSPIATGMYKYSSFTGDSYTYFKELRHKGIGYNIGVKFYFADTFENTYVGFHYLNAGKVLVEETLEEAILKGWALMIGGNYSIWDSRFFIDWSINGAIVGLDTNGAGAPYMLGVSIGLGYYF